jgi:hypothetical protein
MLDRRSNAEDIAAPLDDEHEPDWSCSATLHGLAQEVRGHLNESRPRRVTVTQGAWVPPRPARVVRHHTLGGQLVRDLHGLYDRVRLLADGAPPGQLGGCLTADRGSPAKPRIFRSVLRCGVRGWTGQAPKVSLSFSGCAYGWPNSEHALCGSSAHDST